jgi:hypothetical protein
MGSALIATPGDSIAFDVHLAGCPRAQVHLFVDGVPSSTLPELTTPAGKEPLSFQWKSDNHRRWIRAEVRDSNGSLRRVSNPIYILRATH